jgi:alkanesulfonate monooxygenase SsuD/methylene tetrahydromethanopterin reductase-like flavin-dependent oxidoreductase (luciferase family)
MLRIALPHADAWNSWYADTGNAPQGVARLRTIVDDACRDVGRDPAEVERTVAVLVQLHGGRGRVQGDYSDSTTIQPLAGSADVLADGLRAYAAEGIGHVQLVLDPITRHSIEQLAPVLEALDQA